MTEKRAAVAFEGNTTYLERRPTQVDGLRANKIRNRASIIQMKKEEIARIGNADDSARSSARSSARGKRQSLQMGKLIHLDDGEDVPQLLSLPTVTASASSSARNNNNDNEKIVVKDTAITNNVDTSRSKATTASVSSSTMRKLHEQRDYFAPPPALPEIQALSEEDKLLAMLGHTTTKSGAKAPYLYREDFCGACGLQHLRPDLMDMYPFCASCYNTLREPNALRLRWNKVANKDPLEICMATFGDRAFFLDIVDVTETMRSFVQEFKTKDRISIKPSYDLSKIFGCDPCPGHHKQLCIRYRIGKVHGWVIIEVTDHNRVPQPILFIAPKHRLLRILRCTWGHPRGRSTTGRMSIDVQEQLQGQADMSGGSYLIISSMQSITRLLGDPCPGYPKDLLCEYEISGFRGVEKWPERHGHLVKTGKLQTTPIINPLIFVENATYGMTLSGRRERIQMLNKELGKIAAIKHRRSMGMLVQASEIKYLKMEDSLKADKKMFQEMELKHIDISFKLQRIIDIGGGAELRLEKGGRFDPNAHFGNPDPGKKKLLEVSLICHGHDSERRTDSYEMTPSGYPRNMILGRESKFNIIAEDDKGSKTSSLGESLVFSTYAANPLIVITNALYGHPTDLVRNIDVTAQIQEFVKGRSLVVPKEVNLDELLQNPCPGVKKRLYIEYVTRGFQGCIRVREKDDFLIAALELGYPPIPPSDE